MADERDMFANFERMRHQIDELFGDAWRRVGYLPPGRTHFTPRVDVYLGGRPRKVVIVAELPGVKADEVSLEVRGRDLLIRGRRNTCGSEERDYQQIEIESGDFERRVELVCDVDPEGSRATYEDGMLRIELPVAVRPGKTVEIDGI